MVILAIIDFGRYFWVQHNLNLIAAEAVRAGITAQRYERDIGSGTVTKLQREQTIRVAAIEAANRFAKGLVDLGTVNPYSPKNITIEHSDSDNSYTSQNLSSLSWAAGPGDYDDLMRVTVTADFKWLTPFMQWLGASASLNTLTASNVQRNRGDEDEFTTN